MPAEKKIWQGKSAMLLVAAIVVGCSVDDTEIVGACVADGDAVRVVIAGASPQPGLLDGNLLVAWVRADGSAYYAVEAEWFGRDLATTFRLPSLGRQLTSFGLIAWARDAEGLVGQGLVGVDAMGTPYPLAEDAIMIVRVTPTAVALAAPAPLPISRLGRLCADCASFDPLGGGLLNGGFDSRSPIVGLPEQALLGGLGVPIYCGWGNGYTSVFEPILFTSTDAAVAPTRAHSCQINSGHDYPNNLALVRGADSMIGMLFRRGECSTCGNVHYVLTDELGNTVLPPVQVGPVVDPIVADVGWDLHGVTLGEVGGVLYRERMSGSGHYEDLTCYRMRAFHGNGSDAADAAFQVGCFHHGDQLVTRSMDLVELGSGDAVVIWGERTGYGGIANLQQTITSSTQWDEGIYMTMVTPTGRRGSETVRVTPPEATMLGGATRTPTTGPSPADFTVRATSEGDHVVVTWTDTRPDAPGIYARSYHCRRRDADAGP